VELPGGDGSHPINHQLPRRSVAQGKAALEPKWRDHQIRYVRRRGPKLDESQATAFIQGAFKEMMAASSNAVGCSIPGSRNPPSDRLECPGILFRLSTLVNDS
jgi:hypothetical protein